MAEKSFEIVRTGYDSSGVCLVKWSGLGVDDVGTPFKRPARNDRSVHVKGTFGAGGTIVIEGSNEEDPESYATLNDPSQNPLTFGSEKVESILENVLNIRPRVSAGDETTNVDVYMLLVGR